MDANKTLWVVEYNFMEDSFTVRELSDHVAKARKLYFLCEEQRWACLGVYDSRAEAKKDCDEFCEMRAGRQSGEDSAAIRRYLESLRSLSDLTSSILRDGHPQMPGSSEIARQLRSER